MLADPRPTVTPARSSGAGEPVRPGRAFRLVLQGLVRALPGSSQRTPGGTAAGWSRTQMLLLALVGEQPGHGYEIERRYERRFGRLLPIGRSSVFRMLPALAEQGYLDRRSLPRGARLPQASYEITAAGHRALGLWLRSPLGALWRPELLARLDVAPGVLDLSGVLELLGRYEEEAELEEQEVRRQLADLRRGVKAALEDQPDLAIMMRRLTLEERLGVLAEQRQWAPTARKELQQQS